MAILRQTRSRIVGLGMWSARTAPHLTESKNVQYHTYDESLYNEMSFAAASART